MNGDDWQPISTAPRDGTRCLFYSPGNPKAGNENAHEPHMTVDFFSARDPDARRQYPEAPYTHWQPLPSAPVTRTAERANVPTKPITQEVARTMVAALRRAEQFIVNGVDLGFIRMPDADTPDTAHETLPAIRAAISLAGDTP